MRKIEFRLPQGAGGMAAGYRSQHLRKRLSEWAEKHNATIDTVTVPYKLRVTFFKDSDLTLFALEWEVSSPWDQFTTI